jgi:ABC-type transporter Mla subunit MlaD
MSEETFRIVVAVAVLIACLAFVVQAGVMIALFRLTRKMQAKTAGFMEKAEPVLAKVEPVFDKIGPVIEKIGPALDSINAAAAKVGPAIDRFRPVVDRAVVVVVERTGVLIQSVNRVTATANLIMQDVRPRIADISDQTVAIVRSGREQVERVGDLLHDAGDRTHARLEQIDHAVEATIKQIENVSGTVKSAVLRPVREVNGIAAGISAAVSTLIHGQHKSSVDSATQDEEMFI